MKKNKIYAKKINKVIHNNQKECYVSEERKVLSKLSIDEKINELLNSNGYLFSSEVKIVTNDREFQTSIAGKINNKLITIDNDIINIDDICDLIIM